VWSSSCSREQAIAIDLCMRMEACSSIGAILQRFMRPHSHLKSVFLWLHQPTPSHVSADCLRRERSPPENGVIPLLVFASDEIFSKNHTTWCPCDPVVARFFRSRVSEVGKQGRIETTFLECP